MLKRFSAIILVMFANTAIAQTTAETFAAKTARAKEIIDQATQMAEQCVREINSMTATEIETCRDGAAQIMDEAQAILDEISEMKYDWILIDEGASLIDDSPSLVLIRLAREANSCRTGGGAAYFAMRCKEGKTTLLFELDNCLYSGLNEAGSTALIRIGSEPAQSYELTGDGAVFSPILEETPKSFIERLFGESQLVFRAQPFSAPQQTIAFDITGLEEAITPLREACHW